MPKSKTGYQYVAGSSLYATNSTNYPANHMTKSPSTRGIEEVPECPGNGPVFELPASEYRAAAAERRVATSPKKKPWPLIRGPAAEVTPPARAEEPHLPPDATAEAQPTAAWAVTLNAYSRYRLTSCRRARHRLAIDSVDVGSWCPWPDSNQHDVSTT